MIITAISESAFVASGLHEAIKRAYYIKFMLQGLKDSFNTLQIILSKCQELWKV